MEKLRHYIKDHKLTVRSFAKEAGVSPSFLSELLVKDAERRKSPSLATAQKIETATGGYVGLTDWPKLAEIVNAAHVRALGSVNQDLQALPKKHNSGEGAA